MHNRDVTANYIRNYVESVKESSDDVEEDEEEKANKRDGMSDTAYYHSLGKGF
jgi:hypothetical protein